MAVVLLVLLSVGWRTAIGASSDDARTRKLRAKSCIGDGEKIRPHEVYPALSDNCKDVDKDDTCEEECKAGTDITGAGKKYKYTCTDTDDGDCSCFEGPVPQCHLPCTLPDDRPDDVDVSACDKQDNTIRLKSKSTMCIHAYSDLKSDDHIFLYPCTAAVNEQWDWQSGDTIRVKSKPSMCINALDDELKQGNNIVLSSCSDAFSWQWQSSDSTIRPKSKPSLCMYANTGSFNKNMELRTCSSATQGYLPLQADTTCKVSCSRGYYGTGTVLSCPEYNEDPSQNWKGTMPSCKQCFSTTRPSSKDPETSDNCGSIAQGETCKLTCKGDSKRSITFTCKSTEFSDDGEESCTCFSTDESPLDCPTMNKCKAPDLGPGDTSRFDDSDCRNGKVGSCTVRCAEGYLGDNTTFKCTGPPYRTVGTLPKCHPPCNVTKRPNQVWDDITDDCKGTKFNQSCTAGCELSYRGDQQKFTCWETDDDDECNCFTGRKPYCETRHFSCVDLPALRNAKLWSDGRPVSHGWHAYYKCEEGYTRNGTKEGDDHIELQCKDGRLVDFDKVGCAKYGIPPLRPSCNFNNTLNASALDASKCEDKVEGESCIVKCAKGYYAPKHSRYDDALPSDQMPPTLLVCHQGKFLGVLPYCVKGNDPKSLSIIEFDVYAAFQKNGSSNQLLYPHSGVAVDSLPDNINVFDLEGLLNYLYTSLMFFQQQEALIPNLYRDEKTGEFAKCKGCSPDPLFPVSREFVDTLVWYRLRMRNPDALSENNPTRYEFGTFADFQHGGAANNDAQQRFASIGGVVGLNPQLPGFVKVYKSKNTAVTSDEECGDPSWIGTSDWDSKCKVISSPQFDPRYRPNGRLNFFSLPGSCPNKKFSDKQVHGKRNPECTPGLGGGRCSDKEAPDGTFNCTFTLEEIVRVPLADVTGMGYQDIREFQRGCSNSAWRRGVKYKTGSGENDYQRECVEYAVGLDDDSLTNQSCNDQPVNQSDVWSCFSVCNKSEVGLPFFKGRCDPKQNGVRLKTLREKFERAAKEKSSAKEKISVSKVSDPMVLQKKKVEYIQDCGKFSGCEPDTMRGLNYCERDSTGICGPCFIPNTTDYDKTRVANLDQCSSDLFDIGGYQSGGTPDCDTAAGFSCCRYLRNCPRSWKNKSDSTTWTKCGTTCGHSLQYKPVVCENHSDLGDCRKDSDLGDPKPSGGNCSDDGEECNVIKPCEGKSCSWEPWCDDASDSLSHVRSGSDDICMPKTWGPVESQCAWGTAYRYKHCSYYESNTNDSGESFCSAESPWVEKTSRTLLMQSRIKHCALCDAEEGACEQCAAPDIFSSGRCENSKPVLTLQLHISLPESSNDAFIGVSFQDLEKRMKNAMKSAGAWSNSVFLLDVYNVTLAESSSLSSESIVRRLLHKQKLSKTLPSLGSAPFVPLYEPWTFVLALQLDVEPSSINASDTLNQATPRLQKVLGKSLGEYVDVDPESIDLKVGELTLLCPGLQAASHPWERCSSPGLSGWIIALIVVGSVVLLAVVAMGVYWKWQKSQQGGYLIRTTNSVEFVA